MGNDEHPYYKEDFHPSHRFGNISIYMNKHGQVLDQDLWNKLPTKFDILENKTNERVNHPDHYNKGKIEVIDFIEDKHFGFSDGNVVKYLCRYKHKNGIEDLRKSSFYLNYFVQKRKDFYHKEDEFEIGFINVNDFIVDQNLNYLAGCVIKSICLSYENNDLKILNEAVLSLKNLIQLELKI